MQDLQATNTRKVNGVKKIAVLRANALGDFIFALPAINALRQTYPDAELVFLGKKWHKDFLDLHPAIVDRTIVVPSIRGVSEPDTFSNEDSDILYEFFKDIQKEHFDIAIQIHGGGRNSNAFLQKLKASLTVGTRTPDAPLLDRWVPYIYYQNETLRYLDVVGLIGAVPSSYHPTLSVTLEDEQEIGPHLPPSPFIVIHPGATDLKRRWNSENFAVIGDYLKQRGYTVVITGVSEESTIISQIAESMRSEPIIICDLVSIGGLAALMQKSELVISNDTGPLHLANAVGCRTIGLFWCGNLINGDPLNRTRHTPLISWTIHCPLCGMNIAKNFPFLTTPGSCQHQTSFVDSITPNDVKREIDEILIQKKSILISSGKEEFSHH